MDMLQDPRKVPGAQNGVYWCSGEMGRNRAMQRELFISLRQEGSPG